MPTRLRADKSGAGLAASGVDLAVASAGLCDVARWEPDAACCELSKLFPELPSDARAPGDTPAARAQAKAMQHAVSIGFLNEILHKHHAHCSRNCSDTSRVPKHRPDHHEPERILSEPNGAPGHTALEFLQLRQRGCRSPPILDRYAFGAQTARLLFEVP